MHLSSLLMEWYWICINCLTFCFCLASVFQCIAVSEKGQHLQHHLFQKHSTKIIQNNQEGQELQLDLGLFGGFEGISFLTTASSRCGCALGCRIQNSMSLCPLCSSSSSVLFVAGVHLLEAGGPLELLLVPIPHHNICWWCTMPWFGGVPHVAVAAGHGCCCCYCISIFKFMGVSNICPGLAFVLAASVFFSATWCFSISSVNFSISFSFRWSCFWHISSLWAASSSNSCLNGSVSLCLTIKKLLEAL